MQTRETVAYPWELKAKFSPGLQERPWSCLCFPHQPHSPPLFPSTAPLLLFAAPHAGQGCAILRDFAFALVLLGRFFPQILT